MRTKKQTKSIKEFSSILNIILEIPLKFDINPNIMIKLSGKKYTERYLYEIIDEYVKQLVETNKFKNYLRKITNRYLIELK